MTRPLPPAVDTAIHQPDTSPIYLIEMGWDLITSQILLEDGDALLLESGDAFVLEETSDPSYLRVATWGGDITWGSLVWAASGARVQGLTVNGGQLILPNDEDDVWLTLVTEEIPRGRSITIYEYHDSDAVEIFSGIMDEAVLDARQISIRIIEGLLNKHFPPTSFNVTDFPHLLSGGDRLYWGPDIVLIE